MQEPSSLKSFLSYTSQLSGASILFLSSVLTVGSGCNLMAAGRQVLLSFLVALEGWCCWWLWHPCLLIEQEILHISKVKKPWFREGKSPADLKTWVSCIAGRFFTVRVTREVPVLWYVLADGRYWGSDLCFQSLKIHLVACELMNGDTAGPSLTLSCASHGL